MVGQGDDSDNNDLVALSNGCICCSLQTDLVKQLSDLSQAGKFDYIVIEASGICDPAPIAQTIAMMPRMDPAYTAKGEWCNWYRRRYGNKHPDPQPQRGD